MMQPGEKAAGAEGRRDGARAEGAGSGGAARETDTDLEEGGLVLCRDDDAGEDGEGAALLELEPRLRMDRQMRVPCGAARDAGGAGTSTGPSRGAGLRRGGGHAPLLPRSRSRAGGRASRFPCLGRSRTGCGEHGPPGTEAGRAADVHGRWAAPLGSMDGTYRSRLPKSFFGTLPWQPDPTPSADLGREASERESEIDSRPRPAAGGTAPSGAPRTGPAAPRPSSRTRPRPRLRALPRRLRPRPHRRPPQTPAAPAAQRARPRSRVSC